MSKVRSTTITVAGLLISSAFLMLAFQNCAGQNFSTKANESSDTVAEASTDAGSSSENSPSSTSIPSSTSEPPSASTPPQTSLPPTTPPSSPNPLTPDGCLMWNGNFKTTSKNSTEDLQLAVSTNKCVEVQSGVFEIKKSIKVPSGHILRGLGKNSILKAEAANWSFHCCDTLVDSGIDGNDIAIRNLTLDGSGIATYAIGFRGIHVENVVMTNARCSGVGIAGPQMKIINSTIKNSALTVTIPGRGQINCASGGGGVAEGAAIYALSPNQPSQKFAPLITGNTIYDNFGPALDCDGVFGGTFSANKVYGNKTFAAVSLYGASDWSIIGNSIQHPNDGGGQPYHPDCARGTAGAKSSAIFLCQDTGENNRVTRGNRIENNQVSSFYGILSVGSTTNADWIPQKNVFKGNSVLGSNVGCTDDLRPGQIPQNDNIWENNNCKGTANSAPDYF